MSDAAYAGIIDGTWWLPVLHGHDGVRLLTCWEPPGVPVSGQRWASREQPPRPESRGAGGEHRAAADPRRPGLSD